MGLKEAKQLLRKNITSKKKEYTNIELENLSNQILKQLEQTDMFQHASNIALYYAIKGEVQTASFIEKWKNKKNILLPVVTGNDLYLLPYTGNNSLKTGAFGILEPIDTPAETSEKEIDLIIVPGIAFDRKRNRLGRGKGFYDRLLSTLDVPKIGICFDFQLFANIPAESFDKKMDLIITEKEII